MMLSKSQKHIRKVTDLPFRSSLYSYHGHTYRGLAAMDRKLCYLLAQEFFEGTLKATGNKAVQLIYKGRKLRQNAGDFEIAPIQVLVMCADTRVEGVKQVGTVNLGSPRDDSVSVVSQGRPSDVSFMKTGQVVIIADRDIVARINDVHLVSRLTPYQESFGFRDPGEYCELMIDLKPITIMSSQSSPASRVTCLEANVIVSELDVMDDDVEYLAFLKMQHSRGAESMLRLNLDQKEYKADGNYLCLRYGADIGSIPDEDYEIMSTKVLREQLRGEGNEQSMYWCVSNRNAFEVQERLRIADRLIGGEVDVKTVAKLAGISWRDVLLALDDGRWGIVSLNTACYSPLANRGANGRRFRPLLLAEVIGVTIRTDAYGRLEDRLGRPLRATGSQMCIHLAPADGSEQATYDKTMWNGVKVN